ncbi:uncharacterized protein At2g39910 [Lycium barbarum]|uniref:uncharacterized protein At2g39910 n=1 Tax=Lycium barbarum TaxID=112863 RepID=UPI00293EBAEA|nr:uncharacterized protein At2g39910 [Lycium barbarum]XP_060188731.1 uncharacterized protein At2g39910 [Lycium barbarum]XP_060188732.1 uncharacterized protein At2g39910 [Lycium barbarum]XP_060188733.1 uncharacterized protein At2g39910 [Lycium barbarum]
MSKSLNEDLLRLSKPIRESLSKAAYTPPEGSNVSIKSMLQSLLSDSEIEIRDFSLCCAALASASGSTYNQLIWVPNSLSVTAASAFRELSKAYATKVVGGNHELIEIGEPDVDLPNEKMLAIHLFPQVLPLLKDRINESTIDKSIDGHEISAASARVPLAYAVLAAYQFRWLISQVDYPHLGKVCPLVIPCALTALDHWSSEVKGQGMVSLIHLAENVNAAEIGWYEDVILDACCQNIASDDGIWEHVVQMSVLMVTFTQKSNPRSIWYEKLLNEMLSHLERQPRNKERRIAWLQHIEPLFNGLGLILLAHFRRLFPLFFQWMHADDDITILLVLERVKSVVKLTWIRNSPHIERLVDELVSLYKEAALKIAREEIRKLVLQTIILIQQSKGSQFKAAWDKHKDDPDLTIFHHSFSEQQPAMVAQ